MLGMSFKFIRFGCEISFFIFENFDSVACTIDRFFFFIVDFETFLTGGSSASLPLSMEVLREAMFTVGLIEFSCRCRYFEWWDLERLSPRKSGRWVARLSTVLNY